jgi:ATP-dependent HslUV protease, peptidase subunit HslV
LIEATVKKVRKLQNGKILAGFAGSTADAFTLFEKFEEKLSSYNGQMQRAAVELARAWRQDKYLQKLQALLIVMDGETALLISGQGDVIEPDDNILAIGSGGFSDAEARAARDGGCVALRLGPRVLRMRDGQSWLDNEPLPPGGYLIDTFTE